MSREGYTGQVTGFTFNWLLSTNGQTAIFLKLVYFPIIQSNYFSFSSFFALSQFSVSIMKYPRLGTL